MYSHTKHHIHACRTYLLWEVSHFYFQSPSLHAQIRAWLQENWFYLKTYPSEGWVNVPPQLLPKLDNIEIGIAERDTIEQGLKDIK